MTNVFKLIEANGLTLHGDIEHFAALVAAAEHEACAKVCDETLAQHYMKQTIPERDEALLLAACADCATAIRARGNDETTKNN